MEIKKQKKVIAARQLCKNCGGYPILVEIPFQGVGFDLHCECGNRTTPKRTKQLAITNWNVRFGKKVK